MVHAASPSVLLGLRGALPLLSHERLLRPICHRRPLRPVHQFLRRRHAASPPGDALPGPCRAWACERVCACFEARRRGVRPRRCALHARAGCLRALPRCWMLVGRDHLDTRLAPRIYRHERPPREDALQVGAEACTRSSVLLLAVLLPPLRRLRGRSLSAQASRTPPHIRRWGETRAVEKELQLDASLLGGPACSVLLLR
mmetsp:Transcript_43708/g.99546  ORF Transcript_43708/g.99546 Transcript_43708/m.99546 type:complete len:200 (+) Transcript_43708:337-936(+)